MIILILMFVGASVGSTGGGIKVIRHVVAFKSFMANLKRLLHPNSVVLIRVNRERILDEDVSAITSFIILYLVTFVLGSVLLIFLGVEPFTSATSVLTTMGGIGPGFGDVGPASNFASIPEAGKVLLSFLMILGRLELTTVFVLFTLDFWKD
jgi:trk system potassium uptake protein TrkH